MVVLYFGVWRCICHSCSSPRLAAVMQVLCIFLNLILSEIMWLLAVAFQFMHLLRLRSKDKGTTQFNMSKVYGCMKKFGILWEGQMILACIWTPTCLIGGSWNWAYHSWHGCGIGSSLPLPFSQRQRVLLLLSRIIWQESLDSVQIPGSSFLI